jgi:hypothetical protein
MGRPRGDQRRSENRGHRWATRTHRPTLAAAQKAGQGAPVHASRSGARQVQIRGTANLAHRESARGGATQHRAQPLSHRAGFGFPYLHSVDSTDVAEACRPDT